MRTWRAFLTVLICAVLFATATFANYRISDGPTPAEAAAAAFRVIADEVNQNPRFKFTGCVGLDTPRGIKDYPSGLLDDLMDRNPGLRPWSYCDSHRALTWQENHIFCGESKDLAWMGEGPRFVGILCHHKFGGAAFYVTSAVYGPYPVVWDHSVFVDVFPQFGYRIPILTFR